MASAVRDDNPVVYLMHYLLVLEHGDVPEGEHLVPIGEAAVRRPGSDVTIVATGWTVGKALEAAETLAGEGIDAEVIDPRSLQPLDMPTILASVEKTGHLVLADQATRHASAASIIAAEVAEHGFGVAQGADQAGHRARRHDPLQRADGGLRAPRRAQDRRRGARGARHGAGGRLTWRAAAPARPEAAAAAAQPHARGRRRDLLRTMWRIRCFEERVATAAPQPPGPRADPPEHRLRGRGRRGVRPAARRRRRLQRPPRPRPRAGQGRADGPGDGRADGPLGRAVPRPGRLDAPGRRRARVDGRDRRRRRQPPAGRRRRAGRAGCAGGDQVTVVFFGDGAVQAGHFNETINLAALWELPLIFVCENNGFAEFTPRSAHTKVERVSRRGGARTTSSARPSTAATSRRCGPRSASTSPKRAHGTGPFLLECLTHRRRGHYEGDQQAYRDALAEAEWAKLDPIARFQDAARQRRWITAKRASAMQAEARVRPCPGCGAPRHQAVEPADRRSRHGLGHGFRASQGRVGRDVDPHGRLPRDPATCGPERIGGQSDARADIYGLGVSLYELICCRPAFAEADRAKLLDQVLHHDPPRPRQLDPQVPRDLETIVLKAMARDPAQRYGTADALAEGLPPFPGRSAHPSTAGQWGGEILRWCRRNPIVTAMASAVGLALILGTTVAGYFAVRASREEELARARGRSRPGKRPPG